MVLIPLYVMKSVVYHKDRFLVHNFLFCTLMIFTGLFADDTALFMCNASLNTDIGCRVKIQRSVFVVY